jgi:hypothetical protein
MAAMTLDDKLAMVDGTGFSSGTAGYVGHVAANPWLCIPGLNLEDGPQGVADSVPGVTQLPAPAALAAAWDPALARAYGTVVGSEERGKGADVNLGPTVNIVRDPRWGRAFESYGEDPYLAGQTAAGFIGGVQSQGVMSQVKHLAVYNQETNRNTTADDAVVSRRAMQEIYLPQFEAAVTQGRAASVMCSYSRVNGPFACENPYLLTHVLRQQWHFGGFTTSDEGRTFAQGFTGLTQDQAAKIIASEFGSKAPAILARYPWSSYPSPYTAAYQIGDIWTDSGFLTGIGGCPEQNLAAQFAATTPTFFYQFDDLHAPGLNNDHPGYQWGAGHAMELAYLWPSFNNGFSLYDLLTPAQLQLSRQMVRYWGAFTAAGAPEVPGQPLWPRYTSRQLMSLRPGGRTRTIPAGTFAAEHQCSFWNAS